MESRAMRGTRPGEAVGTLLRLEGADALALLHRISTQSLLDLEPGRARATLFCDPRGRLLHRAWVARGADGVPWLLRDDAATLPLADYVERFIFREDVRIGVPREDWSVRLSPGSSELEPGRVREQGGLPAAIQIRPDWTLTLVPAGTLPPDPGLERARIRAGLPRHHHEIDEAFNPYEVGLAHEIHLSKGCYTGQEALLRLVTYKSVRRRLARVTGAGPSPEVPREVRYGGQPAGWITSVAAEPDPAAGPRWTGLAVLRNEACEPGVALAVQGRPVEIAEAFAPTRPLGIA